ncbi:hypothetical protein HanIR_Chr13g0626781 [Helianthus annuus]|nr:hypothetical protein HanIR_Chr13g0626781 [Helianthus annuus]
MYTYIQICLYARMVGEMNESCGSNDEHNVWHANLNSDERKKF